MIEIERKTFEDLEFHYLETEARMEEEQEIIELELSREEQEKQKQLQSRVVSIFSTVANFYSFEIQFSQCYCINIMIWHK